MRFKWDRKLRIIIGLAIFIIALNFLMNPVMKFFESQNMMVTWGIILLIAGILLIGFELKEILR